MNYILSLRESTGVLLHQTKKKTGFIGFMIDIMSVLHLYETLVPASLKYILTYKLSQDHLELFFGAIRCAGSCNNNPTVSQFAAAYKRLLLRHQISTSAGNCNIQDKTKILHITLDSHSNNNVSQAGILDISIIKRYDLDQTDEDDQVLGETITKNILTEYKRQVIPYMAGYVVRMVDRKLRCEQCLAALRIKNISIAESHNSEFLEFRDRGGLIKPSASVVSICEITEQYLQRVTAACPGKLPQGPYV